MGRENLRDSRFPVLSRIRVGRDGNARMVGRYGKTGSSADFPVFSLITFDETSRTISFSQKREIILSLYCFITAEVNCSLDCLYNQRS